MSVQVSYKKQFTLVLMLFFTLLALTEIAARVYDYYNPNCGFIESEVYHDVNFELKRKICQDNDKLLWNNEPLFLIPNQHLDTININSDGFRGSEISKEKTDGVYRIFIIGGSTTFGVGTTSDSTTIAGYLQKKFDENLPHINVEVINAGIPKAYSYTETKYIENKLLQYHPDIFIIYDGVNDINYDYKFFKFTSIDYKITDKIIRDLRRSEYTTANVVLKWYFNFRHDTTKVIPFDTSHIDEKVSLWKNGWNEICNMKDKENFGLIITLQPLVGSGTKQLSNEEMKYYEYYDHSTLLKYYEKYVKALEEISLSCTAIYDLRGIFDSYSETIYFDSVHIGDFGNGIIAQKFYEISLPLILEKSSNQT